MQKIQPGSVEESILKILSEHPEGVDQDVMKRELPGIEIKKLGDGINQLLKQKRVRVGRDARNKLIYQEIKSEVSDILTKLEGEEHVIYQYIANAGSHGIWSKDIKDKSNIAQNQVTKLLRSLETKKLIKAHKSVSQGTSRKVYILASIEPHVDVSGDIWYKNGDLDKEFIDTLHAACAKYLALKGSATVPELTDHIKKSGLSKNELKVSNIQSIIDVMIYDAKVERIPDSAYYRLTNLEVKHNGFTMMPCGTCPVFDECTDEGDISPRTCVYFTRWLGLEPGSEAF
ncbi:hypothetical protein PROFUN_07997 [Planoprotostelium fungivorum]|uniref:DNA-directed RNA polymerase III subunit RPC6 n=1 Tax=Planoprotostelium fungivorum TaxID=1890364 RepID=A0A2P6MV85_9EUKA|nr:hypothetical protein PROFUN_07997 [Planoprotostelium fungivorum]